MTTSHAIPPLPAPPLFERLAFESPWPLAAVLAAGALGVALLAGSLGRRRALAAALALLALAAGALVLARAVTTDRERVRALTRDLVDAVARADVPAVDRLLAPEARAYYARAPAAGLSRDAVLARIAADLAPSGPYAVREHRINEIQAALDAPGLARTQVRVTVTPEATAFPHGSWWRLDWRRQPDGAWRADRIEALHIAGLDSP